MGGEDCQGARKRARITLVSPSGRTKLSRLEYSRSVNCNPLMTSCIQSRLSCLAERVGGSERSAGACHRRWRQRVSHRIAAFSSDMPRTARRSGALKAPPAHSLVRYTQTRKGIIGRRVNASQFNCTVGRARAPSRRSGVGRCWTICVERSRRPRLSLRCSPVGHSRFTWRRSGQCLSS